jgi:hypothetical protein
MMREFPQSIDVSRALRSNGVSINVPPRESVTIGPFEARYAEAYRIAEVQSFDDLQALGLVPRTLSEDVAREAMLGDDDEFRTLRRTARNAPERGECSCHEQAAGHGSSIRRSRVQSRLAEALASSMPAFRNSAAREDAGVVHIYQHLRRWFDQPARFLVGLVRANNIFIETDGVLVMSPTVSVLDVDTIDIRLGGRLRFQGSNVNVRCSTLNGEPEAPPPVFGPSPGHTAPWPPPIWPPVISLEERAARYLPGYAREKRS